MTDDRGASHYPLSKRAPRGVSAVSDWLDKHPDPISPFDGNGRSRG